MTDGAMARPRVLMWRNNVLARSETFIRNQAQAIDHFEVSIAGLNAVENGLHLNVPTWVAAENGFGRARIKWIKGVRADRGLQLAIRRIAPDLVHAHFGYDATTILPFVRRASLPLLATFHGNDVTALPYADSRMAMLYRRRLPELFAYANRLVVVSDYLRTRLIELGAPEEKVVVNYVGVPISSHPLPDVEVDRNGVLFVGRLVEVKGPFDLLEAFSRLPKKLRSTRLTVVGDGPLRSALERKARSLGIKAKFTGMLTSDQVDVQMRKHAVFCGPSRTATSGAAEAFGLAFVEAGLNSLPSVGYFHGGVPEAVLDGTTGYLVPEGDVAQLAMSMSKLLADPERAQAMGRAAAIRVRREFDISVQHRRLQRIYSESLFGSATISGGPL